MKQNIFLFTWEEKFLLYQELGKRKKSFLEKYWWENIFEFKSDDINVAEIFNAIFSWWLFVSKKLIIIFWLPKDTDKDNSVPASKYNDFEQKLVDSFQTIPDSVVLVFVSFTPDKRLKTYKFLAENINIKEFPKLNENRLKDFAKSILKDISQSDLDYLVSQVWDNMFGIYNESNKLKIYSQEKWTKIDKDMIDNIIYPQAMINSFELLDKMFFDKKRSLQILENMREKWADTFQFLWMLYWWLKSVLQMIDLYSDWMTSSKDLASKIWVHPFVVAKNMKIIDKLLPKQSKIKEFFEKLIYLDYNIKTWKIPAEIFWLEIKNIIMKV